MALNTETETRDLDEAIDFTITCVENICSEKQISLSDEQKRAYAALIISNNFETCAYHLYSEVIAKLFNLNLTPGLEENLTPGVEEEDSANPEVTA